MRVYSPEETAALLPYARVADEIRTLALSRGSEGIQAPGRTALPLPEGGTLLVMPAADGELAVTKLVTVHPENASRDLPSIQGEVVVMNAVTGERLGVLDGSVVTARRTAALSLLAARELAPRPEGPLLILGAGVQGRSHLEAFREGLGVLEVCICSRTPRRAEELSEHASGLGMSSRVVERPEDALEDSSLVVTATTSEVPVLPARVSPQTFIAAVGSFQPQTSELPPRLVAASKIVVDTLEGAQEEAGDLLQAESAGLFDWRDVTELDAALNEDLEARDDKPLIFESVGYSLWDLAAARAALGGRE